MLGLPCWGIGGSMIRWLKFLHDPTYLHIGNSGIIVHSDHTGVSVSIAGVMYGYHNSLQSTIKHALACFRASSKEWCWIQNLLVGQASLRPVWGVRTCVCLNVCIYTCLYMALSNLKIECFCALGAQQLRSLSMAVPTSRETPRYSPK